MSAGVIRHALWDRQRVRGQILWHSHSRHTPGNLLLFMEIINSMSLKMKRQKSPCRSHFGCLEVQIKKRKRVVLFSWQSLRFDSWNLQAWLWELLHPVFRFVHQRIQNWVEWKHIREGIVSRWTPSAADESSGSTIFKSIFVYAKTVNRLLGPLPKTCPNKNHSYMPCHAELKHPSCPSELQKAKMKWLVRFLH